MQVSPDAPGLVEASRAIMSLAAWFVIKALLGIGFVVGLTIALGGSPAVGVTVGCGLSFVLAQTQ